MKQDSSTRASLDPALHVMYLSPADEAANIITHGIGFLLSLGVGVAFWLVTADRPLGLRLTCVVFSLSMAVVYLFSTLSHAVHEPRARHRMRAWDQGTIYLLIAGTYSPFIWEATSGFGRLALMLAVWLAAIFGFYSKVFSAHRVNAVSTLTYVLLGWLPAIPIVSSTPAECVQWMVYGGLSYTAGIVLLMNSERMLYLHAGWHLMVMLGSACHCYAIYRLLQYTLAF